MAVTLIFTLKLSLIRVRRPNKAFAAARLTRALLSLSLSFPIYIPSHSAGCC
jgi:hypothetical protein